MIAIQRANPKAFAGDNINQLKRGQVLRIPSESHIREVSAQEAAASIREQNQEWRSTQTAAPAVKPARIETVESPCIAIEALTLHTPDARKTLVRELSFELGPHERLLIVGGSGVGKTSLLRAIAGLWRTGSGRIQRPPLSEILFLPQRPYMVLGSLRQQLCYPRASNVSDAELASVLERVGLFEWFDREFARGSHNPLHQGDLEAEAIPDRRKQTRMACHLTGKRIAHGKGRIEFCADPEQPPGSGFRDFFGPCIDGRDLCRDRLPPYLVLSLYLTARTDLDIIPFLENATNE